MQAIIMAAGKGSRLGSLTESKPKSLLEIKGKRLLDINIAMLHKYGIWDITIVTGYQDWQFIEATKGCTKDDVFRFFDRTIPIELVDD